MIRRGAWFVIVVLFAVAGCSAPAAEPAAAAGFDGDWHGAIELPGQPLQFGIHIEGTSGTIDIPAQMITQAPLGEVSDQDGAVRFTIPGVPGDPTFTGTLAGDAVTGTLTQSGQQLPFSLARGVLPAAARPQEPVAPYPYRTEDVTLTGGGGGTTLAGTVTAPEGAGPFPGVVLITGSGAQDRDETIAEHKPFLLIADTLTRAGFVVLRTDDRGVGGSQGTLEGTAYETLADDALAGAALLRARSDVNPAKVGLFGHSEGGYLAPLAVTRSAPGDIAFTVLMAGPAVRGDAVLREQNALILRAAGADQATIDAQLAQVDALIAKLESGDVDGAVATAREQAIQQGTPAEQADAAAGQVRGLLPFLTYDPVPALRALRVPTYAFFGGKDLQVPAAQSEQPMRDALASAPGSEVRVFDGLNHLMQPAQTGSPTEYATIETTIDPAVLDAVTAWLRTHTAG